MLPALAVLAAVAFGRAAYPKLLERRQLKRRPLSPSGIIVGADAIRLFRENAPGVLLLHGGGDTPQVLERLAAHLYDRGFSVSVPLLTGHGRALSALAQATADDWHSDAQREFSAMRESHEWVGVVGLSMGGALAVKLAADRSDVQALVLLAPYLDMPTLVRRMAETSSWWGWLLPYFSSRGAESIHDAQAASRGLGHGIMTPEMLHALQQTVAAGVQALPHVKVPTLVIQSREDNRITPESAERAYRLLGSPQKRFVWTKGAGHVITVDYGHQRVFELTADWLERQGVRSGALQRPEGPIQVRTDPSLRAGRHPRIRSGLDQPDSRQTP